MPIPALVVAVAASAVTLPAAAGTAPAVRPALVTAATLPSAVTTAASASVPWTHYTVRRGDTLSTIAAARGTTVSTLVAANKLTNRHFIRIGQKLLVPTRPTASLPGTSSAAPSPAQPVSQTTTTSLVSPVSASTRAQVRDLIASKARAYGVDPQLALAIGYQESGWNQTARSGVGAIGVMQVMPANRAWLSSLAGRSLDLSRTEDNITAGVLLLRYLVQAAPTRDHAIGGYYQGLPSLLQRGAYDDTIRYIASVKALMGRL